MRIAIGSSVLGKERKLPPYVTLLLSSSNFSKHKIKVFPYGTQNPDESIITKILRLPLKLIGNTFRMIIFRPDIIHLNSSFNLKSTIRDISHLFLFRLLRKKVCLEFHGSDLSWASSLPDYFKRFLYFELKNVNKICVLSSEERSYFQSQWNLRNIKTAKVPIDAKTQLIARSEIGSGALTLLYVGRVIETKGVSDIIRAVSLLKDRKFSPIPFLRIVGEGANLKQCKMLSKQLGITFYTHFTGWVPEEQVQQEYLVSDFFILPTFHCEGMPIVILYALKYALPIITTRIRGIADYLTEPDNCLFTDPQNPKMIAEQIKFLIENPEIRERMARNNRQLATKFDSEIVAEEFIAIYESIIKVKQNGTQYYN